MRRFGFVGGMILAIALAYSLNSPCASADTIDLELTGINELQVTTMTGTSTYYVWSYGVYLASGSQLDASGSYNSSSAGGNATGDGVTLYDFYGYQPGNTGFLDLNGFAPNTAVLSGSSGGGSMTYQASYLGGYGPAYPSIDDSPTEYNISLNYVAGTSPVSNPLTSPALFLGTLNVVGLSGTPAADLQVGSDDDEITGYTPSYEETANDAPGPAAPLPASATEGAVLFLALLAGKFAAARWARPSA